MKYFSGVVKTLLCILLSSPLVTQAQSLLQKPMTIDVKKQRLDNVLEIISNKGNFYFSYNTKALKADSLISLSVSNKSVGQVLQMLFPDNFEFRESGNYVIIRPSPIKLTLVTNKAVTEDKFYAVSGYVLDDRSGNWIHNASVYEKSVLASALTNSEGYFKIRLKQKNRKAVLTVSKEFYEDAAVSIDPGFNQQISVSLTPVSGGVVTIISPEDYFVPEQLKLRVRQPDSTISEYTFVKQDTTNVENTRAAKLLVSTEQKVQSINLRKFFTSRPYQVSVIPGVGSHGKLSGQVSNHFSLNIFGGYNGGVKGLEMGGLFNIDKRSVEYIQLAGLFNVVGGEVKGLQLGGLNNTVLKSVYGLQASGVSNIVRGNLKGLQLAGVYNHVSDSVQGLQIGGVGNFAKEKVSGSQIAGVANISNKEITGVQIAGVINYAKHLKGIQIGLINIADSSDGLGIGFINIVLKGYHKLSLSTNEVVRFNAAFKTGNRRLYNILQGGMNVSDSSQVYSVGYGLGTELNLGKRIALNPELITQQLYLGSWDYANILSRLSLHLNVKLGRYVSLYAGPSFSVYYSEQFTAFKGYKYRVPGSDYKTYDLGTNVKGWLGWNIGINFF